VPPQRFFIIYIRIFGEQPAYIKWLLVRLSLYVSASIFNVSEASCKDFSII